MAVLWIVEIVCGIIKKHLLIVLLSGSNRTSALVAETISITVVFLLLDAILQWFMLLLCLCVHLCVCVSHASMVSKQLNIGSRKEMHTIAQGI